MFSAANLCIWSNNVAEIWHRDKAGKHFGCSWTTGSITISLWHQLELCKSSGWRSKFLQNLATWPYFLHYKQATFLPRDIPNKMYYLNLFRWIWLCLECLRIWIWHLTMKAQDVCVSWIIYPVPMKMIWEMGLILCQQTL